MLNVVSRRTRQSSLAAIAVVAVLSLAACGDDDDAAEPASTGAAAAQTSAAPADGEATATTEAPADGATPTLEELTSKGTETAPPTEGPAPAKGKSVWWVSCGMQVPDCSIPAENAKEAAGKLGIKFNIADGKLNVGGGDLTAMRTAIAASPDAIIVHGIACPVIKSALVEAKNKGIKTMPVEATDCEGGSVYTSDMKYGEKDVSVQQYFGAWGTNIADNLIAMMGGKAKIINNHGTYDLLDLLNDGFLAEIKKCAECEIVDTVPFQQAEQIPNGPYIQRVRTAVIKNTDATAMNLVAGSNITSLGGAKLSKELKPDLALFSGTGMPGDMDLVRSSAQKIALTAHSSEWMGYGAMDNINRVLNGQETVPQGIGFRTVTKDANMPKEPGTSYQSPVDIKALYGKLWGAS